MDSDTLAVKLAALSSRNEANARETSLLAEAALAEAAAREASLLAEAAAREASFAAREASLLAEAAAREASLLAAAAAREASLLAAAAAREASFASLLAEAAAREASLAKKADEALEASLSMAAMAAEAAASQLALAEAKWKHTQFFLSLFPEESDSSLTSSVAPGSLFYRPPQAVCFLMKEKLQREFGPGCMLLDSPAGQALLADRQFTRKITLAHVIPLCWAKFAIRGDGEHALGRVLGSEFDFNSNANLLLMTECLEHFFDRGAFIFYRPLSGVAPPSDGLAGSSPNLPPESLVSHRVKVIRADLYQSNLTIGQLFLEHSAAAAENAKEKKAAGAAATAGGSKSPGPAKRASSASGSSSAPSDLPLDPCPITFRELEQLALPHGLEVSSSCLWLHAKVWHARAGARGLSRPTADPMWQLPDDESPGKSSLTKKIEEWLNGARLLDFERMASAAAEAEGPPDSEDLDGGAGWSGDASAIGVDMSGVNEADTLRGLS